jgi:hypothetical protein
MYHYGKNARNIIMTVKIYSGDKKYTIAIKLLQISLT